MARGTWMEEEIRQQPAALRQNADRYAEVLHEALHSVRPQMVLLVARGSSDHAALYARYLLEIHLGIPVSLAAPSVLTRYGARIDYPPCLTIGISQSGAAPDVSEVTASMREAGHPTLGITNTPGSRLTEAAEHSLTLDVGEERSIAATKTYTASLLAVVQLVRALGAELPDPKSSLPTDECVEGVRQMAENHAGLIVRSNPVFALGRGYGFCTALETALKLMECALIPAKSYSTADFEHGPKALAAHGSACILYGQAPPDAGTTDAEIVHFPGDDEPYSPIRDIVFGQWLALLTARARGLDPDRAPRLSKVTKTL